MPAFATNEKANVEEFVPEAPQGCQVRVTAFMAPILRAGESRPLLRPMTLFLEVPVGQAETVCYMTPRIQDAVVGLLFEHPIPFRPEQGLLVEESEQRLVDSINGVLGQDVRIQRAFLIPGVPDPAAQPIPELQQANIVECGQT